MTHGTLSGYTHHRCRCDECRAAVRTYWQRVHADRQARGVCLRCQRPLRDGQYLRCWWCRREAAEAKARTRAQT